MGGSEERPFHPLPVGKQMTALRPLLCAGFDSFLIDDQLLRIILRCCAAHHSLALSSPLSELAGAVYVYLWGMAAALLNVAHATTMYLSPAALDTVARTLGDAIAAAEASPDATKYAPSVQYYCVHVLWRVSGNAALRMGLITQQNIDACLRCLGFVQVA